MRITVIVVRFVYDCYVIFFLGGVFMRRQHMERRHSRRSFTKGAQRVHPKNNMVGSPMRGGIRL